MINPDYYTIVEKQALGLWNPINNVAGALNPYIKRIKKDNICVLDYGAMSGDNIAAFVELDKSTKIKYLYYVSEFDDVIEEGSKKSYVTTLMNNLRILDDERVWEVHSSGFPEEHLDILSIDDFSGVYNGLDRHYESLLKGGIVCGNGHSRAHVKEALAKFRRENKIGTHINVAHDCWFWMKE